MDFIVLIYFSYFALIVVLICVSLITSDIKHLFQYLLVKVFLMEHQNLENCTLKKFNPTGHQWLTPIILATWEAEVGRTVV
jgi:hypothetical protein